MYKSNWRMQIGKTLPTNFWWFSFMAYCLRYAQNLVAVFALLDILAFTQLDPAFRVINAARNPTKYGSNVLTQSAGSQHAKIPIHHVQWWLTRLWVCFNSFISHLTLSLFYRIAPIKSNHFHRIVHSKVAVCANLVLSGRVQTVAVSKRRSVEKNEPCC